MKKRKKPINVQAVVLSVSIVLFAIGIYQRIEGHNEAEQPRVMVIPKGTDSSVWWQVVRKGALKAANDFDVQVIWDGPISENDREQQIEILENALTSQVDGVVIAPNDFEALARPIEKVHELGIPCVIIDSNADTQKYVSFISTNNYKGGQIAALSMGRALNGSGRVAITKFVQNSSSTDQRVNGFKDTILEKYPNISIVAEEYTNSSAKDARRATDEMLSRDDKIDGLYAVNHSTSVGAYKSLRANPRYNSVAFVCFDADPILIKGIRDKTVSAIVVQNPFSIGYEGVKTVAKAIRGGDEEIPSAQAIPSLLINAQNLDSMIQEHPLVLGIYTDEFDEQKLMQ